MAKYIDIFSNYGVLTGTIKVEDIDANTVKTVGDVFEATPFRHSLVGIYPRTLRQLHG